MRKGWWGPGSFTVQLIWGTVDGRLSTLVDRWFIIPICKGFYSIHPRWCRISSINSIFTHVLVPDCFPWSFFCLQELQRPMQEANKGCIVSRLSGISKVWRNRENAVCIYTYAYCLYWWWYLCIFFVFFFASCSFVNVSCYTMTRYQWHESVATLP